MHSMWRNQTSSRKRIFLIHLASHIRMLWFFTMHIFWHCSFTSFAAVFTLRVFINKRLQRHQPGMTYCKNNFVRLECPSSHCIALVSENGQMLRLIGPSLPNLGHISPPKTLLVQQCVKPTIYISTIITNRSYWETGNFPTYLLCEIFIYFISIAHFYFSV